MVSRAEAQEALKNLMWEFPAEFSEPLVSDSREGFRVIKKSNVRNVHRALLVLQEYLEER